MAASSPPAPGAASRGTRKDSWSWSASWSGSTPLAVAMARCGASWLALPLPPATAAPGRLLARSPLFWWDHMLCLLDTGLRCGEFAGLRLRRVHLHRAIPVLQVVDTRYQAGRFGSGFKPRPKSDAGIREIPWLRWWSRRSAGSCRPSLTLTPWSSPLPAAAMACPLAQGPPCRATASAAPSRPPPVAPNRPRAPAAPGTPRSSAQLLDLAGGGGHPGARDR
jgi:hypothetical protein